MKYRKFGRFDERVSVLGMDLSHIPVSGATGLDDAVDLIRHAIDTGVNYLDLGSSVQPEAEIETGLLLKQSLADRYRDRASITAHLRVKDIAVAEDFDRLLERHLTDLVDTNIDNLILDGINRETWPVFLSTGALARAESAIQDGRIAKLGFGYRDQYHYLKKLLEEYDNWDIGQFHFSFMDVDRNPGINGIRHACDLGLAIVISEPLRHGLLSAHPPEFIITEWTEHSYKQTLTEWGMRWVWNHPEVHTVVVAMTAMKELDDILLLEGNMEANNLSMKQQIIINQLRDAWRKLKPVPCSACRNCMPCPKNIDVPRILELYNDAIMFRDIDTVRKIYQEERHNIIDCDECGSCVKSCGRMIAILDWLKEADNLLGQHETIS